MAGYSASIIVIIVVLTLRAEVGLDSVFSGHVNNSTARVLKSRPEYFGRVLLRHLTLPDIPKVS